MANAPSLIFITGGVRSGKSRFAEQTARRAAATFGGNLHYIATAVAIDDEMTERIKKHQNDRKTQAADWNTLEQSTDIGELAPLIQDNDILLLDCVTTLLTNELYAAEKEWDESFSETVYQKITSGILALKNRAKTLIIVSNEVLNEPIGDPPLIATYKRLLGHIHQTIVREADLAYLVEAGIPIAMKKVFA